MTSSIHHSRNFLLHLQERQGYDRPVLTKEPAHESPTTLQINQLHNEYAITRRLANVPGVRPVYAKEGLESQPVLLLEYIQGKSVSELIQEESLDLNQKLQLAVNIAATLGRIHEQKVMHKDICSSNILVADDDWVYIIDFGVATTMRQEEPEELVSADTLTSSLAYISPEQSGRIYRLVDYRTDLYSLGVTLYELFANQLPFETDDALEMIHYHLAQNPTPLPEINAEIPLPLSDIVLKLLGKNAEDRFQSARGLQADLQHCLTQLQATGQLEPFELGCDDFTDGLLIPQKLYGRQAEIDQLLVAFDRVFQGNSELLLVTGYAGVGKTSLVHEIHKSITAKRGRFVEGKFDQYRRSIPYFAWGQAFDGLVDQWLRESETELARWRRDILETVGKSGQVLIDVIPSLEQVLGPQQEVPEVGGTEHQNRFNYFFQRFVRTVATPDQPLVVFLDDLQWIDLASLNLLKTLLTDPISGNFLVVGAYRDNEVDAGHSLMLGLNDLEEAGGTVNQLTLGNLALSDINQLLSDSLRTPTDKGLPLAQLVQTKTDGNAFFTHELLHTLEDDGLLSFDQNNLCWQWELAEIEQMHISNNVIDLMVNKIRLLPVATQEVLKIASCLGNQFELTTLNLISRQSSESTQQTLQAAYQEGLIVQLNEHARFVHDRVQEAAYTLIAEPELAPRHWQIGRTLLEEIPLQAREERLFDVVDHLNLGTSLIETDAERLELAELNLNAAQQALQATAYSAASEYARIALDLLDANSWQTHYRLTLKLHQLAAEATYLNLDYEQSQHYIATILANAHSLIDRVPAHITQIQVVFYTQDFTAEAIEIGLGVLDELGFPLLESKPTGVTVQAISELSPMTDPQATAAAELLNSLWLPANVSKPQLIPSLLYTGLDLVLKFGVHPSSCMLAMVNALFVWYEDIDQAYRYGQLALQLSKKPEAYRYVCQVGAGVYPYVFPWKSHYRTIEQALKNTAQIGLEVGDTSYAMSSLSDGSLLNIFLRDRLDQAQENMNQDIRLMQQYGKHSDLHVRLWTQFVVNLRGRSDDPLCFEGPVFDEESDLIQSQTAELYQSSYYLHLLKLILHYHLGYFKAAFDYSEEAEPMLPNFRSHYLIPLFHFYQSLAILQLPDVQSQPSKLLERVEQNLQKLQLWAHYAPMNHQHKVDLILAEQARVAGDVAAAMDHYEAAIAGARDNKYLHEEALANELYGRFWDQRGNDSIAQLYLREAHALYDHWGAVAIVDHLETQYPQWLNTKLTDTGPLRPSTDTRELHTDLDLQTILKASQAIASEIKLDNLLSRLITIVMENAGAQRGFLILEKDGQWLIEAFIEAGESDSQVMQAIKISENNLLSTGIVHYVANTQQTVVLEDAAGNGEFVYDPYVQRHQVRSLLCTPLVNIGRTSGILYLENNMTNGVFTPERLELLNLLLSQMAISIDQARIYANLEQLVEERTVELQLANEQLQQEIAGRIEAEQGRRESHSRLTSIVDAMMDAIITINEEQIMVMFNPAATRMFGYAEADIIGHPLSRLMPARYRTAHTDHVQVFGQTNVTNRSMSALGSLCGRRANGEEFPIEVAISQVNISGQKLYTAIVRDISERKQAESALRESEEKFRSIAEQSPNMIFISQNDKIVFINQQSIKFMDYSREELTASDFDLLSLVAPESIELVQSNFARLIQGEVLPAHEYTLLTRAGDRVEVIIAFRLIDYESERAILGVVTDVSGLKQIEVALQKAIDEQQLLLDSSRTMTTALELEPLLNVILDYLDRVVKFTGAVVYIREGDDMVVRACHLAEGLNSLIGLRFALDALPIVEENITLREPIIVNDTSDSIELIQVMESAVGRSLQEYVPAGTSLIAVPLIAKDNVIAIVVLSYNEPGYYSGKKTDLLQAFANQAAIAIDNARLYQQVQRTAVLEERDRLASELHDAVTQTLFSASVIAKALPDIWEKDPAIGRTYVEQLPGLLQGALAEMRTLLLELRPSALRDQTLGQLLEMLADAARAHSGAIVTLKVEGDRPLPEDVTIALHRIAQESLNNITKHAEASEVKVRLICDPDAVVLHIADDGRGFDPETVPSGHLGVGIMRERAQKIGATFQIDSKPGDGTLVVVTWSDQA